MTIVFKLERWRLADGPVQRQRLHVRKAGTRAELEALRERMAAGDVVRLRAHVVPDSLFGRSDALLVEAIGRVDDARMEAERRALEEPVTFDDERFGTLTLDRALSYYGATVRWGTAETRLMAFGEDRAAASASLQTARALWGEQARWQRRVEAYVVDELLELKNETWVDDEDPRTYDAASFLRELRLESIHVRADGRFEFWYDPGDLFFGHWIQVRGTLERGPTEAGLAG
jgi:hypothetical protein